MVEQAESTWDDEIRLVKQGDESAARRLVERLYPHVIRIIRAHLPNRSDDEDAAQEVFMKVFTKLDQYRCDQPLDHWVARITVNHCHDRLRQLRSRRVLSYAELNVEETTLVNHLLACAATGQPAECPEDAAAVIQILLAGLNEREQIVLRMLDLEQRPVREIAALTGWGESKIKVTAMRARRRLGERLKELERRAQ
jgi:RNA polymerase sigma-70 factor (ECF subfamily)